MKSAFPEHVSRMRELAARRKRTIGTRDSIQDKLVSYLSDDFSFSPHPSAKRYNAEKSNCFVYKTGKKDGSPSWRAILDNPLLSTTAYDVTRPATPRHSSDHRLAAAPDLLVAMDTVHPKPIGWPEYSGVACSCCGNLIKQMSFTG